jgi:biopolymer transport protein ExbB/TolQ
MIQSLPFPDGLLVTIVLATLAIGLPIVLVLSIRFLLDRSLNLGRSKELEKLIWQLHRIASAMEHQMNLPSSAAPLATQKPRDVAPLQQLAAQPPVTTQSVAASTAAAAPATPATHPVRAEQPESLPGATQPASVSQTAPRETPAQGERHGVNSMFGL